MNDATHSFEYLCFQRGDAQSDEIFAAVEHGFGNHGELSTLQSPISLANFLDFSSEINISSMDKDHKKLHQTIIVKTYANRAQKITESIGKA